MGLVSPESWSGVGRVGVTAIGFGHAGLGGNLVVVGVLVVVPSIEVPMYTPARIVKM